jgi:predicted ATP-binding protein involved in virulence
MRIDRLEVENFKKFSRQTFDLHRHFTLFIGDNGAGKTTVLDALAVAAGIWLVKPPDSTLAGYSREIFSGDIRIEEEIKGDRIQFREQRPVKVRATGRIGDRDHVSWTRQIREDGKRTSNADAKDALALVKDIYERDHAGFPVLCPVLAYYGAGRAWLPSNERIPKPHENGPARRWAAFYDCFNERIRFAEVQKWFNRESVERGNRSGRWRPGFDVVRRAILRCIPEADDIRFDSDRDQIVLSIDRQALPFGNLSAGQRMMLAMVADLAIKAVTQNAFLLPPDELPPGDGLPEVLVQTPGIVLIDELDVHLHPKWQRRVSKDLKGTFPGIQFVCTSHSPQVIGEMKPEEIRSLDNNEVAIPEHSFGMDSNRVLEEIQDAPARNEIVQHQLQGLFHLIDQENFGGARDLFPAVEAEIGPEDPELARARTLMSFLESDV